MITTLKGRQDVFTSPETEEPGALLGSLVAEAQASLKAAQLLQGRTKARLAAVREQLPTAETEAKGLLRQIAEAIDAEQIPPPALQRDLTKAQAQVQQLEAALALAMEKDAAAQQALEDAERTLEIEKAVAAIQRVKRSTEKVEAWRQEGRRLLREEFCPDLDAMRLAMAGWEEHEKNWVNKLQLEFRRHLFEACALLIPEGKGETWTLRDSSLVHYVLSPDIARTRKRG